MAYLDTVPSELIFNTESGIYIKYEKGSDKVMINESYYKLSCLEEFIQILKDVISVNNMAEQQKIKPK